MSILALGVSYRRAPVELLERLTFADDDLPKAYHRAAELPAVRETVILSTCNRVEVYARVSSYHAGFQDLKRLLSEAREVEAEDFSDPLYAHYEDDAAHHLFRVAAGADSMVVGEPQILAQVRRAIRMAEAEGASGPLVTALFRGAVRAGKRARAETAIGSSPGAFVTAGADAAERVLGPLAGRTALVVGAGAMASMTAAHLRDRGVGSISILSRSAERAGRLAATTGAGAASGGLERLADALAEADLVVASTGAPGVVVGQAVVRTAMASGRRGGRPLVVVDLAVPRDVDPAAADVPGVTLVNIDGLRDLVRREGSIEDDEAVEAIVGEEAARFAEWRRAAALAPLIRALRDRGERVLASELQRIGPRLAGLTDRERETIDALAHGIVAKLLHQPIVRLKELSGPGSEGRHARALAELFDLDLPPPG